LAGEGEPLPIPLPLNAFGVSVWTPSAIGLSPQIVNPGAATGLDYRRSKAARTAAIKVK